MYLGRIFAQTYAKRRIKGAPEMELLFFIERSCL